MRSKQIFLLLKPLSIQERAEITVHLDKLLRSKGGGVYQLYAEISSLKIWKASEEARLYGLFKPVKKYYKNRVNLTEHLLMIIGKLRRKPNTTHDYDFAIQKSLFKYVLGTFERDVQKLLKQEDYMEAAVLLEKGEMAIRRQGIKKDSDKKSKLPDYHTVLGWSLEELKIKYGIESVKKANQLTMSHRSSMALEMLKEYKGMNPKKPKTQRMYSGLMARIYWVLGRQNQALEWGGKSLEAAFENASSDPDVLLDEFAYLIPLLIDSRFQKEATRFIMKIGAIRFKTNLQERRRARLEIENLIATGVEFCNCDFAKNALEKIENFGLSKDDSRSPLYFYLIALTYFKSGDYAVCSRMITKHIAYTGKPHSEVLWFSECLKMLSFFQRGEDELTLEHLKFLKKSLLENESELPDKLCEMMEELAKMPIQDRKGVAENWVRRIEKIKERPANIRSRNFFDIYEFLIAYTSNLSMAEVASNSQRANPSTSLMKG